MKMGVERFEFDFSSVESFEYPCGRHYVNTALKEIQRYREIGTVEECREAVEKQKPKKPEESDSDFDYYKCPVCDAYIWATDCVTDHNYCLNCGQAIDWEESEE